MTFQMTSRFTVMIPTTPTRARFLDRAAVWYDNHNVNVLIVQKERPLLDNIAELLRQVQTPYAAFCADDDLISPPALMASMDWLNTHPDYSVCWGEDFLFGVDTENKEPWGPIEWVAPVAGHSEEHYESYSRVRSFLSRYSPTGSALHRTDILQQAYRVVLRNRSLYDTSVNLDLMAEWVATSVPMFFGKMKRLPMLYIMRQQHRMIKEAPSLRHTLKVCFPNQFRWVQQRYRMWHYWKEFDRMRRFIEGGPGSDD